MNNSLHCPRDWIGQNDADSQGNRSNQSEERSWRNRNAHEDNNNLKQTIKQYNAGQNIENKTAEQ